MLVHAECDFFVPPRIVEEAETHLDEIARRAKLPRLVIANVLADLFERIERVPPALISPFLAEATRRTEAADAAGDEQYVALALALDAPIWTYDDDFRRIQGVRLVTTSELEEL